MIYLKNASWERIHLNLTLELGRPAGLSAHYRFYLVDLSGRVETELADTAREGETVRLSLNVTNNGLNRCVESGTYRVLAFSGEGDPIPVLYEGDFENGVMHGRGKYTWTTGNVYEGDFENGVMHGRGRYTWPSGDVYEGDFRKGKFSGRGQLIKSDGNSFKGRFKDGRPVDKLIP